MNRQPVFTDIPILVSMVFDPPAIGGNNFQPSSIPPATIFTSTDPSGSLIERVTVSATGDVNNTNINGKVVCLYIYDDNNGEWSLYKSATIPYATLDEVTPNPTIEWTFTGGILLPLNFQLGIAATTNSTNTGEKGDYLAVTVEGSSYSQV